MNKYYSENTNLNDNNYDESIFILQSVVFVRLQRNGSTWKTILPLVCVTKGM